VSEYLRVVSALLTCPSLESSSSVMQPFFANQSCDPFMPQSTPCQLGNYVQYAVKASKPLDVQAAVMFANWSNIRLVVRNTGHEYARLTPGTVADWY